MIKPKASRMRRSLAGPSALAIVAALAACTNPEPTGQARIREALSADDEAIRLVTGDTLHVHESVRAFYGQRAYEPAWTGDDEILERGQTVLSSLRQAEEDGLPPERYRYTVMNRLVEILAEDEVDGEQEVVVLGDLDLILTEAFARYASDLVAGTIDPESGGLPWRIPRGDPPDETFILRVLNGEDPAAVLRELRPASPYYSRMMEALARYREIESAGGWPEVPELEVDIGDRAPGVAALRQRLIAEGDATEKPLAERGAAQPDVFDEGLAEALSHFQMRHDLDADGSIGPATLKELNTPVSERIADLRLNLDRWRWLPRELGDRFILVNIAGYELEFVENDAPVLTMNVVVGQEGWETPVFADTMEYIVANPYWNVPQSILEDEILPAVRADAGYLARNDYEVVDRSGSNVIPAASIDWSDVSAGSFPYLVRQRPGPGNALGDLKFMFPNDHNIYLHDTPAGHLFSRTERAFSHGCIRLEKPEELARALLDRVTDAGSSQLDDLLAGDREKWVQFDAGVPVYILYFTAWVGEDGSVRFHHDIYGQDRGLREEMRRKLT